MSGVIESIERAQLKRVPVFQSGDRVRVHFQVVEGTRRRTQVFEGIVIKRQGTGARETFTVRKQSFGVGVERTFPLHSPKIEKLEVAARGDVRRAKLYYLRGRIGKAARVAERRWGIDDDVVAVAGADGESTAVDAEGVSQEEVVPVEPEETPEAAAEEPTEAEAPAEAEPEAEAADAEPEAAAETETAAETDADAPEAGETEDSSAPEDAEDEAPAEAGDSDEDSKA